MGGLGRLSEYERVNPIVLCPVSTLCESYASFGGFLPVNGARLRLGIVANAGMLRLLYPSLPP